MDFDAIQSYFRTLCKSYYVAYKQLKRLKKECDKVIKESPGNELTEIRNLQKLCLSEEHSKKYLSANFSKQELAKEEEELSKKSAECREKFKKIEYEFEKWNENREKLMEAIIKAMETIRSYNYEITVKSKAEVIVLIDLCKRKGCFVEIASNDEAMKLFPKKDKLCAAFLEAYLKNQYYKIGLLYRDNIRLRVLP